MRYFKSLFGFLQFFLLALKQQRNRIMLWLKSFGYLPAMKGKAEKNIAEHLFGPRGKFHHKVSRAMQCLLRFQAVKMNPGEF